MSPIVATESRDLLGNVLLIVLVAVTGGFIFLSMGLFRRRTAEVAPGLRPGPSDEDLERRIQVRYRFWGAILTIFLALFLPVYWFREPTRLDEKRAQFFDRAVSRGAALFAPTGESLVAVGCANCHGAEGEGGVRTQVVEGKTHTFAEPPLKYLAARYKAAGRNDEEIKQIVRDAVERGRPGTPMPTWGLQFGGPLNAQQVDDLIHFILAPAAPEGSKIPPGDDGYGLQASFEKVKNPDGEKLFSENCAICHGARGEGGIGPNLQVELQRNSRTQVFQTIRGGRLNTNRPSMPAWAHLGDKAIQALVEFIESIQRG